MQLGECLRTMEGSGMQSFSDLVQNWSESRSVMREGLKQSRQQFFGVLGKNDAVFSLLGKNDAVKTSSLEDLARDFKPNKRNRPGEGVRDIVACSNMTMRLGKLSSAVVHDCKGLCSNEGENMVGINQQKVAPRGGSLLSCTGRKITKDVEHSQTIQHNSKQSEPHLAANRRDPEPDCEPAEVIARSDRSLRSCTRRTSRATEHVVHVSSNEYHTSNQV